MLRKTAKKWIFGILYWSGFLRLFIWASKPRVVIMSCHGVMDYSINTGWRPLRDQIDVAGFERQIELLSKYFDFVDIDSAVATLSGRTKLKRHCAVVTFDDGYRNNFEFARPILEKFSCPGTYYLATGFIGSSRPYWFDRLDYALQAAWRNKKVVEIDGASHDLAKLTRPELEDLYCVIRANVKKTKRTESEFHAFVEEFAKHLEEVSGETLAEIQSKDRWTATIAREDLRDLAASGNVEIGSHTVNHIRLTCIDEKDAKKELEDSKQEIEAIVHTDCKHFAYPNGEYDAVTARLVKDTGYISAVTSTFGINDVGCDLFMLRRIHFSLTKSDGELLAAVTGFERGILKNLRWFRRQNSSQAGSATVN